MVVFVIFFLLFLAFFLFATVAMPVSAAIDDYFARKAAEMRAARKRR